MSETFKNKSIAPALYLFPVNLSAGPLSDVLPDYNLSIINDVKYFIVENVRTARRFLKLCNPKIVIDDLTFFELNNHTDLRNIGSYLDPLRNGEAVGIMSEAGCPAIADPGADVVAVAQKEGLRVVPLVGPSSILMSLMASGFNGQGFSFNGYLPIEAKNRANAIRRMEMDAVKNNMSQIFIETPYRNQKLLQLLCNTLHDNTLLCVARDISSRENEEILTMTVAKWRKTNINLDKHPTIFLIGNHRNQ